MKTFNRVDCIKWSIIGLMIGLVIILATSCSPSRVRNTSVSTIGSAVTVTHPTIQDTVWQCSVTGYNEGEFVIQRPNIYYKCSAAQCLKALDKIANDFYVSCDSVVIYKQQITLLDYN